MNRICAYCFFAILIPSEEKEDPAESNLYCSNVGEFIDPHGVCGDWQHVGDCTHCKHRKRRVEYHWETERREVTGPHYTAYCGVDPGRRLKVCGDYDPKPKDVFIEELLKPNVPILRLIRE